MTISNPITKRDTSIDWTSLKTIFGTRVDWVLQDMATTGVHKTERMQCNPYISWLGGEEGVTPPYANQPWMLDWRCDETAYPGTRFDLRLLIKNPMF